MKVSKAIELLTLLAPAFDGYLGKDDNDAILLGIEALKRILKGRNPDRTYVCYLLPGETPEDDAT